jgi:AraC-like DNA-binding protein
MPDLSTRAENAPDMADRLAGILAGDVGRSWKIGDAASQMAISTRSLQRHLAADGRSFSTALRRARMSQATKLLTGTKTPLAEIGYCCGYADQAHFQRDFRRVTNMTPKRFRQASDQTHPALSSARS